MFAVGLSTFVACKVTVQCGCAGESSSTFATVELDRVELFFATVTKKVTVSREDFTTAAVIPALIHTFGARLWSAMMLLERAWVRTSH